MSKNIRLNGNLYLAVLKMGLAAEQSAFDAALSDQQSGSRPPRRFSPRDSRTGLGALPERDQKAVIRLVNSLVSLGAGKQRTARAG
jgi:hypothetical protein